MNLSRLKLQDGGAYRACLSKRKNQVFETDSSKKKDGIRRCFFDVDVVDDDSMSTNDDDVKGKKKSVALSLPVFFSPLSLFFFSFFVFFTR